LNYELETYHEAFNQFPNDKVLLKTESGVASLRKIDILKGTAWYCYEKSFDWIPVDVKRVNEIIALNKEGKTPITLSDTALGAEIAFKTLEFKDDLLGDTDLTRMDDKNKKSRGKGGNSRNNKSGNRNSNSRNNSPLSLQIKSLIRIGNQKAKEIHLRVNPALVISLITKNSHARKALQQTTILR
jgi:hypothetical protein